MKKKIFGLTMAMVLAINPIINIISAPANTAYAAIDQSQLDRLDTTNLERQIKAARYLIDNLPNIISGDKKKRLEELIKNSEDLIRRINKLKASQAVADNLNIRVKNIIRENLDKKNTQFTININSYTSNQEIQSWFLQTAKEDWYFFYSMYGKANVKTKYNSKKSKGDKVYIDSATFTVTYREDPVVDDQVENFANEWVRQNINDYDSDLEKTQKIHDFIVTKNQYNRGDSKDISGGYSIYHPASILYGNGGVCNAYATLFDKLARKSGLDVRYATGYSKKNGEPHIWNMVKVDGNWYNIDTTWDDPTITFNDGYVENLEDFIIYDFFLKSDGEIQKSRTIDNNQDRPQSFSTLNTGLTDTTIQKVGDTYRVVR
ncbi:MAG: transglutaminase domain-containing protein [Anaerococcus sp.]|uniref:transglutaminase domain-containing protein n=1 Tax=Anaerococcus sp. TaxID=1872515 RepID=UPI00291007E3|nr:transglutaminase domain-containing protein [Anaerococcus sp.]MDU4026416.1 transglutaminase domain-containing protein [Anaerococcus sp.]